MHIALVMPVCEGEEAIAWDVLGSVAQACAGATMALFLVDDASPSHVGTRLADRFRATYGHPAHCRELERGLRFHGTAVRLAFLLNDVVASGQSFDMVVKLESDICIVRRDLLSFLTETCPDGVGFFGESYPMRARDSLLVLADLVPFGFARRRENGLIHHDWSLRRFLPVWWADFGRRALVKGFRFEFFAGCFWILGGKTLQKLADSGWLGRDQSRSGFVFADDLLITLAAHALGDPVVNLAKRSAHWGRLLSIHEGTPIEELIAREPYVVHHLKDRPEGWARRRALKKAFGWPAEDERPAPRHAIDA